jgi:tRNA-dihydrouridine synthase B
MFPEALKIRDLTIRPAAVLAPMAGVTDTLFRRVIRGLGGCGLLMTEFTSSEGITRSAAKTLRYLYFQEDEHPITAQPFGANPRVMAEAARVARAFWRTPRWDDSGPRKIWWVRRFGCFRPHRLL